MCGADAARTARSVRRAETGDPSITTLGTGRSRSDMQQYLTRVSTLKLGDVAVWCDSVRRFVFCLSLSLSLSLCLFLCLFLSPLSFFLCTLPVLPHCGQGLDAGGGAQGSSPPRLPMTGVIRLSQPTHAPGLTRPRIQ